jgi:glutamate synthase (NADPH/NADH) small chain
VRNWEEVYQGFDLSQAMIEAARCIHCPTTPCIDACPTHNDIPTALGLLERGDVLGAATVFRLTSTLPEMCGRLCPQERLCEGACPVGFAIRPDDRTEPPVGIGKLEAFVTDQQRARTGGFPLPVDLAEPSGRRVAVVGSGPSGLTVAEVLAARGHGVTVFEQWHEPGGPLRHGIPNFKLAKEILDQKLRHLTLLGVDFVCNTRIGRDITVDELLREHDAVYLGTGAGRDAPANLPGETELRGIVSATDFLVRANAPAPRLLAAPSPQPPPPHGGRGGDGVTPPGDDAVPSVPPQHGSDGNTATLPTVTEAASPSPRRGGGRGVGSPRVVVLGGTDAAMDAMRAALRLGASSVTCVFEGGQDDLHGRREEHHHAREEGVRFRFGAAAVEFLGDETGHVSGVRCRRLGWSDEERQGRRRAFGMAGAEFILPADLVVVALGYVADPLLTDATPGLHTNGNARFHTDPQTGHTTRPGVFAGGDGVHGPDLVVTAMAAGRRTATAIDRYLRGLTGGSAAATPPPQLHPPSMNGKKRRGWFRRET